MLATSADVLDGRVVQHERRPRPGAARARRGRPGRNQCTRAAGQTRRARPSTAASLSVVQAESPPCRPAGAAPAPSIAGEARRTGRAPTGRAAPAGGGRSVSHGATVPSLEHLEAGQGARRCRSSGQSGCAVAQPPLDARPRASPPAGGGARAAAQSSQRGNRRRRSMRAAVDRRRRRATASGWRQASSITTLPPHDWPATAGRAQPELVDQQGHVVGHRGHVVAVVGLVAAAVPPQVDRGHRVAAARPASLADAVPQPGVRGQAVDEEEGDGRQRCAGPTRRGAGRADSAGVRVSAIAASGERQQSRSGEHAPSGVPCSAVTSTGLILVLP